MRQVWARALGLTVFCTMALRALAQGSGEEEVVITYTPHLHERLMVEEKRTYGTGTGDDTPMATIDLIYEVNTEDLRLLLPSIRNQLAFALHNIEPVYVELIEPVKRLVVGHYCDLSILQCMEDGKPLLAPGVGGAGASGSLMTVHPETCAAKDPVMALQAANWGLSQSQVVAQSGSEGNTGWMPPWWGNQAQLDRLVYDVNFCVNRLNTSLMEYPVVLENIFITGGMRDELNTKVPKDEANGLNLLLWIVGRIPVEWAQFFNTKFLLNGSIPLPLYQPEVVDLDATHTDVLNMSLEIIGVRQGEWSATKSTLMEFMPVCAEPPVPLTGCARMTYQIYDHPNLTAYKLRNVVDIERMTFVQAASAQPYKRGRFNVSEGPWPKYRLLGGDASATSVGPWRVRHFPQKESVFQEDCVQGAACAVVPLAPSPRYMHSAILYKTWSFEDHARKYLCNERTDCGRDCLLNLTCLNGTNYFQGNFFFRSSQFANDDGGIVPPRGLDNQDCPSDCCKDRRMCMRVHDVLGYRVPFEKEMILVFGGKTYVHEKDETGRLVYHNCERIPRQDLKTTWRSCSELTVNDIWRYDIEEAKWEYIKADSALSPTTGEPVGYPSVRFGHGAAMVNVVSPNDESQVQKFMYIYGGLGPQCRGGVCSDVWRYEIPWAAQAYYPKFPDGPWNRGNQWDRMKDCPYGGRYRHSMVVTSGQEYIYVYGGQGIGRWYDSLLRYRLSTDLWEDLNPFGRQTLTRLMYDYRGNMHRQQVPIEQYNQEIDVDCANAWRFDGKWAHCRLCPECRLNIATRADGGSLPPERGDSAITTFRDSRLGAVDDTLVMFGGYRVPWGTLRNPEEECTTTTTTTTTTPPPPPPGEQVVLTDPPTTTPWSGAATSTTPSDETGVAVVGTFPMLGGVPITTTTTVTVLTTSKTTTAAMLTQTYTDTVTVTATVTSTEGSSTTFTTTTFTNTTTFGMLFPTTTLPTEPPVSTFPPVEYGGRTIDENATVSPGTGGQQQDQEQATDSFRPGPEVCKTEYYFEDLWVYDATTNQWASRDTKEGVSVPEARRGHRIIARRAQSDDVQLVLFGGHNQDSPMNDMWILDVNRADKNERSWTRVDSFFEGIKPPEMSYHSMHYSEPLNLILVFGGLHWRETDVAEADSLRNIDRRCFKQAQGLPADESGKSEVDFMGRMRYLCDSQSFCCTFPTNETAPYELLGTRIRTLEGALNLTAISMVCRRECADESFYPQFYPIMSEGIWEFKTDVCPGDCSGHGLCDMSQCVCEPSYYGIDCSQQICPGSSCYTHPKSKEQSCVECSGHGRCIFGVCQCFPGWGFQDCSAVLCPGNCSSTATETRGVCLEDFPVHTCNCFGRFSGYNCSQLLCLNDCSGRGACDLQGQCHCEKGFYGDDCSLFTFPLNSDIGESWDKDKNKM